VPPAARCASTISVGQTITCELGSKAEIDSYTFEAKANDVIRVKVNADPYKFGAKVTVVDSRYQVFRDCMFDTGCVLPADGTYTLQVEVGGLGANPRPPYDYSLYVQKLAGAPPP